MAIIRASRPEKNFSVIHNSTLEDQDLSWEALGMLTYLLSKPDGWQVKPSHLRAFRSAGRDKVRRIMGELEEAGYLVREKHRNEKGRWEWISKLYDTPELAKNSTETAFNGDASRDGFSGDGSPTDGSPTDGNPVDIVKTDAVKTDRVKTEGGPPPDSDSAASSSDSTPTAHSSTDDHKGDQVEVEPLLNAFRRAGAILTEKRSRILRRWAQQGFIDNVPLFAEVVQEDVVGTKAKGCKLSMRILKDRYIERVQSSAESSARRNGRSGDGTANGKLNEPVTHATAQKVVNEIRADISSKAQFSEHFDTVDTADGTRFKPSTATAHSVLATLPQDALSQ